MSVSCRTCDRLMSVYMLLLYTGALKLMSHVTRVNKSCDTYEWISHVTIGRLLQIIGLFCRKRPKTYTNESCNTYEWVMSRIWMSHVCIHAAAIQQHAYEWVVSLTKDDVTRMDERCSTYEWVMSIYRQYGSFLAFQILPFKVRAAKCSSVLQCVAVCCSVLQCVAVCCSVLQWSAVCCSPCPTKWVLQCVAVCCSVLQSVAGWCRVVQCVAVWYRVLQSVAVCHNEVQCLTVRYSALQCGKVWCNVL